ncbi:MAG: ferrochelatase [Geodermatophilaceae bacterium]|nr:ferrochelatase [Geodermatophilaceae bacterium]
MGATTQSAPDYPGAPTDDDEGNAVLLLSFGGPEGLDDVLPFLENVTRGRGIPPERLLSVAEHYKHFDGVSPINEQNRQLRTAIESELVSRDRPLPVYWGNRNWAPYVEDVVARMAADGINRAVAFATSAYSSASGCRQYHEDLARARQATGPTAPAIERLPHFYDQPGFITANADALRAALARLPADLADGARIVATAHSIPMSMADAAGPNGGLYERQLKLTARAVVDVVAPGRLVDMVWQSRSGPPHVPWLEPDVNQHLIRLAGDGVRAVVLCPIGFVSDHIEVVWDLDNEASQTARALGLALQRAATAGTHPAFVAMIGDLVEERLAGGPRRLGTTCPATCCLAA